MAQCPGTMARATQRTQCRRLMLVGEGGQMWPESQAQRLPGTGGGPGWLGRLLGGGGHGVVTRTAQDTGPGSDSCSLERKDSLSD